MKFIISVVVVLSLVSTSLSSLLYMDRRNSKHPGKCFFSDDFILPPGGHMHPNRPCIKIVCYKSGWADMYGCHTSTGFGKPVNRAAVYPQCCFVERFPPKNIQRQYNMKPYIHTKYTKDVHCKEFATGCSRKSGAPKPTTDWWQDWKAYLCSILKICKDSKKS